MNKSYGSNISRFMILISLKKKCDSLSLAVILKQNVSIVLQDGWRAKLKARDDNEIDTMFIDKRASGDEKGQILVGRENRLL